MGWIYEIINKVNGKRYIGQTVNLAPRKAVHFTTLKRGVHKNKHLQNSWNKHGEENFIFDILEKVSDNLLTEREQYFVDNTPRELLFNICLECVDSTRGVVGYFKGKKFSKEHRKKIGESQKGRVTSLETRKKLSEAHKGKKLSEEHKAKLGHKGEKHHYFGKKRSKKTCEKISKTKKERYVKENHPMFGKHHLEKTRKKMSESAKKRPKRGPMPTEHRRKIGEAHRGIPKGPLSEETKRKLSKSKKGKYLGDNNKNSKLTNLQHEEIVLLTIFKYNGIMGEINSKDGAYPEIYCRFNISKSTAYRIYGKKDQYL